MRLVSQDGTKDVPYALSYMYTETVRSKGGYLKAVIMVLFNDMILELASYSKMERAERVLALCSEMYLKNKGNCIFQFPEDNAALD